MSLHHPLPLFRRSPHPISPPSPASLLQGRVSAGPQLLSYLPLSPSSLSEPKHSFLPSKGLFLTLVSLSTTGPPVELWGRKELELWEIQGWPKVVTSLRVLKVPGSGRLEQLRTLPLAHNSGGVRQSPVPCTPGRGRGPESCESWDSNACEE